jgi:hypothetical protein
MALLIEMAGLMKMLQGKPGIVSIAGLLLSERRKCLVSKNAGLT